MKLPCEECLKLPICIRRLSVFCTDLAVFAHALNGKYGDYYMWCKIEKVLPNINRVYSDSITSYHHPWYSK